MNTAPRLPNPRGSSPLRKPHSIRRTTSMDTLWSNGRAGPVQIRGLGRDCYTLNPEAPPEIIQLEQLIVKLDDARKIMAIESQPPNERLESLLGLSGFGELRHQLKSALPVENHQGAPLHQLLHDITGSLIVCNWAWASRKESLQAHHRARRKELLAGMVGSCSGFVENSSSLRTDGIYQAGMAAVVPPLAHEQDPAGWHELPFIDEVSLRRARRIDVWHEDGTVIVESTFQDSATSEENERRLAVHEYSLYAELDGPKMALKTLTITPHILPFPECSMAIENTQKLLGTPAAKLSTAVSKHLRKTAGCTHLNDVIRALTQVPMLIDQLNRYHTQ